MSTSQCNNGKNRGKYVCVLNGKGRDRSQSTTSVLAYVSIKINEVALTFQRETVVWAGRKAPKSMLHRDI